MCSYVNNIIIIYTVTVTVLPQPSPPHRSPLSPTLAYINASYLMNVVWCVVWLTSIALSGVDYCG